MKSRRLTLNIISIIASILASLVFIMPTWYFTNTTIINDTASSPVITYTAKIYEYDLLKQVVNTYQSYGHSLNLTLSYVYLVLIILILLFSLIHIILSALTMMGKFSSYNKTIKDLSWVIGICSIISFVIAVVFTQLSEHSVVQTGDLTYSLSINICSGIYLFTIFEICACVCGAL